MLTRTNSFACLEVLEHAGFGVHRFSESGIRTSISGNGEILFGSAINPCTKDQDRLDYRRLVGLGQHNSNNSNSSSSSSGGGGGGDATYCFALFDGHGTSSAVADLAEQHMLALFEEECHEALAEQQEQQEQQQQQQQQQAAATAATAAATPRGGGHRWH